MVVDKVRFGLELRTSTFEVYVFKLDINGVPHAIDAAPDTPLLWVLRDHLNLTGTKFGCGIAACGACAVHVDVTCQRHRV